MEPSTKASSSSDPFSAMNGDEEMKSYEKMVDDSQKINGVVTK
jgi:hypothetical protein